MISQVIKYLLASTLIMAIFSKSKKKNNDISVASEKFYDVTSKASKNRTSVEVPDYGSNSNEVQSDSNGVDPFTQSPG